MPRARRSTPHQSNSRPRGTNPSDIAARLLRVSRRPSCASRKQRVFVIKFMPPSSCAEPQLLYGVLVCGEPILLFLSPFPETPEKGKKRKNGHQPRSPHRNESSSHVQILGSGAKLSGDRIFFSATSSHQLGFWISACRFSAFQKNQISQGVSPYDPAATSHPSIQFRWGRKR